jgi:hypothetical protein
MIGGTDVIIPTGGGEAALDVCLRVIRQDWPEAVVENAATAERVSLAEYFAAGPRWDEVFAYRSEGVARQWDEQGADASLSNTMIHLLPSADNMTVVVDDADERGMRRLLDSLRQALQVDIPK